jgi:hypothetical protein
LIALIISIVALLFAGGAMVFTGLQWWEAHVLGLANDATFAVDVDTEPGRSKRGMIVRNTGPGT